MVGLWNSHKFVWDLTCEINIKIAVFVLCLATGLPKILIYLHAMT